jgi:hypothetical protein
MDEFNDALRRKTHDDRHRSLYCPSATRTDARWKLSQDVQIKYFDRNKVGSDVSTEFW